VRLKSGGVVCLKKCAPTELFAQRLSVALGVRTAGMRLIMDDDEGLRTSLHNAAVAAHELSGDGIASIIALHQFSRYEWLAALEYLDGFGMMGLPAHKYLVGVDADAGLWHGLGRLMGFDALVNNFDRLPLAWKNDGNLENVMLGSTAGQVIGIDQAVNPITHPEGLERYCCAVKQVLQEAMDGAGQRFALVQEVTHNNTGVQLTAEQVAAMRRGCLEFATEVVDLHAAGRFDAVLTGIHSEVSAAFQGRSGSDDRAAVEMVLKVAAAFHEALGSGRP